MTTGTAALRDLIEEWELAPDGPVGRGGTTCPVRTVDGSPAFLKVGAAPHEHLALHHWHGSGAVQLLRADPRRRALLLDRLRPEDLTEAWDIEACEVVAGLYDRLHVPAPPQLRTLSSLATRWADELRRLPRDAAVPRRMVEQAAAIASAFAADADTDGRLVHTELHYENVLAADREPWLAIDPKPLSGDPHYEVAPLLWNRWEEMAGDVRRAVRARFHAVVDAARLDEDRARDWIVLRMVVNAMGAPDDATWVTRCVTVAKSVQD